MSTLTTRTGDVGQNFTQQTYGDTPCSVSLSTNAKGAAQVDIKFVYQTPFEMARDAEEDFTNVLNAVKRALAAQGITLAGQEGK